LFSIVLDEPIVSLDLQIGAPRASSLKVDLPMERRKKMKRWIFFVTLFSVLTVGCDVVVVMGLVDLPEQTVDLAPPEQTANPAPPEAMVPPVLRALKSTFHQEIRSWQKKRQ
jgi:hypothetical protein